MVLELESAGFSFEEFERNGSVVRGSIILKSFCLALKRNIKFASRNMTVLMREGKMAGTEFRTGGIRACVSKILFQCN